MLIPVTAVPPASARATAMRTGGLDRMPESRARRRPGSRARAAVRRMPAAVSAQGMQNG